jgi:hypothetical protein
MRLLNLFSGKQTRFLTTRRARLAATERGEQGHCLDHPHESLLHACAVNAEQAKTLPLCLTSGGTNSSPYGAW